MTAISNRWTAASSGQYRKLFDIGIVDWRILVSLHALGDASAADCVNLVGLDPGAVSRSIRQMAERGLITPTPGRFPGRTKPYRLTETGLSIYEQIGKLALAREAMLLEDLSQEEREQLVELLRRIHLRSIKAASCDDPV